MNNFYILFNRFLSKLACWCKNSAFLAYSFFQWTKAFGFNKSKKVFLFVGRCHLKENVKSRMAFFEKSWFLDLCMAGGLMQPPEVFAAKFWITYGTFLYTYSESCRSMWPKIRSPSQENRYIVGVIMEFYSKACKSHSSWTILLKVYWYI